MSLNDLRATWTTLYKHTLPQLAISRSPVQEHWPVHIDHCFARIILDAVIGIDAPWTTKLKAPAWKNMSVEQLRSVIEFGQQVAQGKVDLAELDRRSLDLRGKTKGCRDRKRKREDETGVEEDKKDVLNKEEKEGAKAKTKKSRQLDIRSMTRSKSIQEAEKPAALPSPPATPAPVNPELSDLIASSDLTTFRQRVLLALCQVPPGRYTTYALMSKHLGSCPRAVGNALRNNPFAPRVPCHRVVASGGGIGGFGGDWGAKGKHASEKVKLLKDEGVRVDSKGERVIGQAWDGFV